MVVALAAFIACVWLMLRSFSQAADGYLALEKECADACPTSASEYRFASNACYCEGKRVRPTTPAKP